MFNKKLTDNISPNEDIPNKLPTDKLNTEIKDNISTGELSEKQPLIRELQLTDDFDKVVELLYKTDIGFSDTFMGNKKNAVNIYKILLTKEYSSYYYKNIRCYDDGEIKGIVVSYDPKEIDESREFIDMLKTVSILNIPKLLLATLILAPLIDIEDVEGLYIQNICVDEKYRGQSIGTKLLEHHFQYATQRGFKSVTLDVSTSNESAKKLYEAIGFKAIYSTKLQFTKNNIIRMKRDI